MAFVNLGQVVYPIGAIYISTNHTSPASIFGGSWSQISGNVCLMAGSYVGNVGSRKITINQMPAHRHEVRTLREGGNKLALVDWQTNAGPGNIWWLGAADTDLNSPNRYQAWDNGGGARLYPLFIFLLCLEKNLINLDVMPNGIR